MLSEYGKVIKFVGERNEQKMSSEGQQHVVPGNDQPIRRLSMGSPDISDTRPFPASKGWLHILKNRFGLKNRTRTGQAA